MNWLRIDAATLLHPKVGRLARVLGCSRREALGIVVSLWCATALAREGGMLDGMEPEDIADLCQWGDDGVTVVRALVKVKWLDETKQGLAVHEWLEYQGASERTKLMHAKRQATYRRCHSDAPVTQGQHETVMTGQDGQDRTDRTEEEEEEERADAKRVTAPHPPPPSVAPLPDPDPDPDPDTGKVIARFPCLNGQTWNATESLARTLDELYPDLTIEDEIRDALAAVTTDPSRQKRPQDMRSFLTRWFKNSMADRRNGGKHAQN